MVEKALYAWQAHTFLGVFGIVVGFTLVSMIYKWRLGSKQAKKKAAKDRADQAARAASANSKKAKQRFHNFALWSLSLAVLLSLILAVYLYAHPF